MNPGWADTWNPPECAATSHEVNAERNFTLRLLVSHSFPEGWGSEQRRREWKEGVTASRRLTQREKPPIKESVCSVREWSGGEGGEVQGSISYRTNPGATEQRENVLLLCWKRLSRKRNSPSLTGPQHRPLDPSVLWLIGSFYFHKKLPYLHRKSKCFMLKDNSSVSTEIKKKNMEERLRSELMERSEDGGSSVVVRGVVHQGEAVSNYSFSTVYLTLSYIFLY